MTLQFPKFPRHWSAKAVLLFLGSSTGGFFYLLSTLAIARIFDAKDVGKYSVVLAISSVLTLFLTLRVEMGIVPAKSDLEAWYLIRYGIRRSFTYSAILAVILVVLFLSFQQSNFTDNLQILLLASMVALPFALLTILTQVPLRIGSFFLYGTRSPLQNSILFLSQISFGRFWPTLFSLIFSEFIARFFSAVGLIRSTLQFKKHLLRQFSVSKLSEKPNLEFLKYILTASILDALTINFLPVVTTYLYGFEEAGQFSISMRLFLVPASLIAASLGSILIYKFSKLSSDPLKVSILYKKVLKSLLFAGSLASVFVYVLVEPITTVLLGKDWVPIIDITRAMIFYIGISLAWAVLNGVFIALQKWKEYFVLSSLRLTLTLISWGFCVIFEFSFIHSVFVVTFTLGLSQLWGLFWLSQRISNNTLPL